jgi:hypothetical protein
MIQMNYLIISLILLATISVNHGWTESDRVSVLSSSSSSSSSNTNANKLLMEAEAASSVLNSKNATNSTKSSGNKNESINNGKLIFLF